jgi:hypothetical protein
MQNSDFRAKQFLPFDSLKGFREAIKTMEEIHESKKDLSIDELNELDKKLEMFKKNDLIKVKYFYDDQYIETIDTLKKVDNVFKKLILKNNKISFDDIMDIELIRS